MLGKHVRGDLDQVGLQPTVVPLAKDGRDVVGGEAERAAQQVVRLGDELDVRVLDAVVDHLHEVTRPVGPDVGAARNAIDLGGDCGEHFLDTCVGLACTTGHEAGAVQRALLPTRDAAADEAQAQLLDRSGATLRVLKKGVAAVDDGVSLFQHLDQRVDRLVDRRPGLDHHQHGAGWFEDPRQVFEGVGGLKVAIRAVGGHELFGAMARPVVDRDADAMGG